MGEESVGVVTIVKEVLTRHHSDLKNVVNPCLATFKDKMAGRGLICKTCGDFDQIMDSFGSSWPYVKRVSDVEERCTDFLHILRSFGGPSVLACESIEDELRSEVEEKLPGIVFLPKHKTFRPKSNSTPKVIVREAFKRNEFHSYPMHMSMDPREFEKLSFVDSEVSSFSLAKEGSTPMEGNDEPSPDCSDGKASTDHPVSNYFQKHVQAKDKGNNSQHISSGFTSLNGSGQNDSLDTMVVGTTAPVPDKQVVSFQAGKDSGISSKSQILDDSSTVDGQIQDELDPPPRKPLPESDDGGTATPNNTAHSLDSIHAIVGGRQHEFADYLKDQVRVKQKKLQEVIQERQQKRIDEQADEIKQLKTDRKEECEALQRKVGQLEKKLESEREKRNQSEEAMIDLLKEDLKSAEQKLSNLI